MQLQLCYNTVVWYLSAVLQLKFAVLPLSIVALNIYCKPTNESQTIRFNLF